MNKFVFLFPLALFASGCDKVDEPLGDDDGPGISVPGVPRRVLLEDCTGHRCSNCPQAARIAEDLKDLYGENLVIVAVHLSSTFAAPYPPLGDGEFDTDFRTPAGDAYETTFSIGGLPKGMVSRKPYENSIPLSRSKWGSASAALIGQEADLDLWFDSIAYDAGSHTAFLTVKAACVKAVNGNHALTIYLTEDSVIDDQLDLDADPDWVPDYVHRHVLRDNVNGTWGEPFVVGSASVGDTLEASYTYTLPGNVLNPEHCSLVAYVHSSAGVDQYEVKQVVEAKLVP